MQGEKKKTTTTTLLTYPQIREQLYQSKFSWEEMEELQRIMREKKVQWAADRQRLRHRVRMTMGERENSNIPLFNTHERLEEKFKSETKKVAAISESAQVK